LGYTTLNIYQGNLQSNFWNLVFFNVFFGFQIAHSQNGRTSAERAVQAAQGSGFGGARKGAAQRHRY